MAASDPPTSDLPPPPTHPSSTIQNHTQNHTQNQGQNQIQPPTRTQPRSNSNPFILDPAPVPQIPPRTSLNSLNTANANANDAFNARRASLSSAPTPLPASSSSSAIPPPVPPSSSKPKSHTHTHNHAHTPSTATATAVFKANDTGAPVTPGSTNPFLQRAKTHSGAVGSNSHQNQSTALGKTPPLPPRKPTSMAATTSSHPPALTGTLTHSLISPLMKQSLEASKQGHALKRAQAEAERARVLEVIRSSNSNAAGEHKERERGRSAGSAGGSRSPTKGLGVGVHGQHVGPRRPVPSPPRSAVSSVFSASSAGSFDQVASARLGLGLGAHAQRRFGSPDADRFSSASGVSGVSGVSSGSASVSSGSSQPSRQGKSVVGQQQQQQIPYSAPPTHPDRRAGVGGSTTPRHALTQAQAHRRSPSYQSTTSAYTSRSQPSRSSPTGDRGGDDDGRGEAEGEGVWPWSGGTGIGGTGTGSGNGNGNGNGKRTRPTRSQSMHQQSSPTTSTSTSTSGPFSPSLSSGALGRVSPPLPPPRRKTRPESVQLPGQSSTSTPTRRGSAFGGDDAAVGSPFANAFESSGSSLFDNKDRDRDKDKDKSAVPLSLSALQRSLSTLHARAQPVLDRARYKAEAGLSRRGFVPHSHSRVYDDAREEEGVGHLVAHGTGGTAESEDTLGSVESMGGTDVGVGVDRGGLGGVDFDESDGSERGGLGVSGRGRTGSGYAFGRERERDSLKLPVEGEGWRPL